MIVESVRVRFAPSPTGHLHIGSLRTALFNWLFARHYNGKFLLRIEDTDLERSKQEYTDSILGSLAWCGLTPDEPLVIQSQRVERHQAVANQLVKEGKAYRCYCTAQEVEDRLKDRYGSDYLFAKYDGYCKTQKVDSAKPFVIRFAIADNEEITFHDLIRGPITINTEQLDDFIIIRSDGAPMYNFVVVVDDADMRITHVIRGEDHISNTFKQLLLYRACDFQTPYFAHLPMILGPSGDKLSKRDGAVSALEYRQKGYLPEALLNYLARLGWGHGDQEIFTTQELISLFTLEQVSKHGAIFDINKLNWVNAVYVRNTDSSALVSIINRDVDPTFIQRYSQFGHEKLVVLITLYKSRVHTLAELAKEVGVVIEGSYAYTQDDLNTWVYPAKDYLRELISLINGTEPETHQVYAAALKSFAQEKKIKLVMIAQPIRIALIGSSSGPGVFELMEIFGAKQTSARLRALDSFTQ